MTSVRAIVSDASGAGVVVGSGTALLARHLGAHATWAEALGSRHTAFLVAMIAYGLWHVAACEVAAGQRDDPGHADRDPAAGPERRGPE